MSREADAKRVFLEALDRPGAERACVLDSCGGDGWLRNRVERLLRAHDQDHAEVGGGAQRDGPALPDRIGRYRILRVIASGGMGVVYEAEQERPRRRVALKVLRPSLAAPVSRFEAEAEALGRLRHPGIARVFEAGCAPVHRAGAPDEAAPYIAMELIPGARPLTAAARDRPLPDRIGMMAKVCAAVQAAHERGVIHRDLKPGNVLVGDDGEPRVIDFGVARLLGDGAEPTLHTRAGQLVGTLGYMSPEQCAGGGADADVRTDVYALGVLLYEVATGRPPHDLRSLGLPAALRMIQERDPAWPPGRGRAWRDAGAVALTAMARDPARRYESAGALARELERVLAGTPVEARPPGPFARLVRWAARRPIAATAVACIAVVVLALGGAGLGLYWLGLRPDHLVEYPEPRYAALQSRAGLRLRMWDAGPGGRIVFRAMVDQPASVGGRRLALVGFEHDLSARSVPGHVEAYDVRRPRTPIWSTAEAPLTPPGPPSGRPEAIPAIELAFLADVIGESDGPELVVVHTLHPFSPAAVQVFDLAGRLRYRVWHDGAVLGVRWLAGPRRLLICGLNCSARWDQRGVDLRDPSYPCFVAGLRVTDGHLADEWLVADDRPSDSALAWYRWLGPQDRLAALPGLAVRLLRAGAGWDDQGFAALQCASPWSGGASECALVIDGAGRIVSRWTNDAYKLRERAGEAPPEGAFELLDLTALPALPP